MHILVLILAKAIFLGWAYYTKSYRNWAFYAYWGPLARGARDGFMRRRRDEEAARAAEPVEEEPVAGAAKEPAKALPAPVKTCETHEA